MGILLVLGCQTYRSPAIPVFDPPPDPQAFKQVIVLSCAPVDALGKCKAPNLGDPAPVGSATHINLSGDTNVGQVPLGAGPAFAVMYGNSTRVMVANPLENTLQSYSALSPTNPSVLTISLPAGAQPTFLYTNQPSSNMFAIFSGHESIGVIALTTNIVTKEISLGAGTAPQAMAGTGIGNKVYVTTAGSNSVRVIDVLNFVAGATVPVGTNPGPIVMSADSSRAYVVNRNDGTVSVINTATDTVMATLTVGSGPNSAILDRRLLRVYVTNGGDNSVSIINADPNSPNVNAVTTVSVGTNPVGVTPLADGSRAYVVNQGSNNVSIINTTSNTVVRTVTVGTGPAFIVSSSDSAKVAVLNMGSNNVSLIRTSDDTVSAAPGLPANLPPPANNILAAPTFMISGAQPQL
ncbi:MAG: YncE family protein [Acidobacteriales bacterium]|nr:YncE family protein [Terriglobales bacterium]